MHSRDIYDQIPPFHTSKLLIIDDQSINLRILTTFLKRAGFDDIESACDGVEALAKIEKRRPDLIISDLLMPRMDGFSLIKTLKNNETYKNIPIIIQTSITDPSEYANAWASGASDIITKPIHEKELTSRLKIHLDQLHLTRLLEQKNDELDTEIQKGIRVQQQLLPQEHLEQKSYCNGRITIDSIFLPSLHMSGDLWGVKEINEDTLVAWIADYSGKGIQAALNVFRMHTLMHEYQHENYNAQVLVNKLNDNLCDLLTAGQFLTFFYLVIDLKSETMTCLPASAPSPILMHENGAYTFLDSSGLPIGIQKGYPYTTYTVSLERGLQLLLYSDELWEDDQIADLHLTEENFSSLLNETGHKAFFDVYQKRLLTRLKNKHLSDDLTLISIKFDF